LLFIYTGVQSFMKGGVTQGGACAPTVVDISTLVNTMSVVTYEHFSILLV